MTFRNVFFRLFRRVEFDISSGLFKCFFFFFVFFVVFFSGKMGGMVCRLLDLPIANQKKKKKKKRRF